MTTYEFTAFSEAQLLAGGDNGSNIGCGDTFTMPSYADTCLSVADNDRYLSGDNCHNENANDGYGQTASIQQDGNEVGNGGQIYAEVYHWVYDQHGNWYVMIEIEQEGSNEDFFTFYTGHGYELPPEGAELTVSGKRNVTSDWVDFTKLGAGDKAPEPGPWSFDADTCTYTIEAESLDLHNFKVVEGAHASEGELVKITASDGKLSTEFGGESGVYNMTLNIQDENDGQSKLKVYVNGEFQQMIRLDGDSDGRGSNNGDFSEFTLQGLEIAEGDVVEIRAWNDGGEFVRIDSLAFQQVKFEECDDPDAVKLDFEGFAAGDVLGSQIDGVTISAMGGADQAMIFDSQNPTGGDDDLETQVAQQGNVLMVSEDGDSSDPDDVVGGKITFEFDNPSAVFDIKVIDTEEGGTITLTLEDGSTQTFDIPNLVNGGVGQVVMDVQNVVRMDVELDGSGAIDDLCFVPGPDPAPLGSLSGKFFCDDNRDGIDNDGAEPGIGGVMVELLDENGAPTGITTETAADGTYAFTGLAEGTYGVQFTYGGDKTLIEEGVGSDDTVDSDATDLGGGVSQILGIEVVGGQDTPDNDAGVEEQPGSLSGTYFCDENRDDVDSGASVDARVANKEVVLLQADGVTPALDIDGNPVGSVRTDANGNYSFSNLAAGSYVVMFASSAAEGKQFVAALQGDNPADDSDVIDLVNGKTGVVEVFAGQDTPNVDAGVVDINDAPIAADDMGAVCVGQTSIVDLLAGDIDPEGDALSVTTIFDADESVGVGGTLTLASGATATLNADGTVSIDATNALPDLLVGDLASDEFEYIVSDGELTDEGLVDLTFKGALNTIDTLNADLSDVGCVKFTLTDDLSEDGVLFTVDVTEIEFPATRLGEVLSTLDVFDLVFCLSAATPIDTFPFINEANVSILNADSYLDAVAGADQFNGSDFGLNPQNIDNVNWLVNEADDLIAGGYSEGDIQRAIWNLVDGGADDEITSNFFVNFMEGIDAYADTTAANELTALALANDGFVAGSGDIVTVVLDPKQDGVQPLLFGVEYDVLAEACSCEDFMF